MLILTAIAPMVIGVPLLAIALIFDILCVALIPMALLASTRRATKTSGEVVEIAERQALHAAYATPVQVAYTTPEGRFEIRANLRRPRLGDPVVVRYPPGKPSSGHVADSSNIWRTLFVSMPVVTVVGALAAGMVIGAFWTFTGSHPSLQVPLGDGSFVLMLALLFGAFAVSRYRVWLRWNRMVRAEGKLVRYKKPSAGTSGPGHVLISFQSATGEKEFWAAAGTIPGGAKDTVTVYYDPAKPDRSATVDEAGTVRAYAIGFTVLTLVFGGLGVFAITTL